MATSITERFRNAWDAWNHRDDAALVPQTGGSAFLGGGGNMSRRSIRSSISRESVIMPIYNRIGIDVSVVDIRHVRVDEDDRYMEDLISEFQQCLGLDPNIDQTAQAFFRDVTMMLCEFGAVAIVPVESKGNPLSGSFDPTSLRAGQIVEWFPQHVRVKLYNDHRGEYEDITLPKRVAAVIENPFYAVMNQPNSTLQRLLAKLQLLDVVDEQASAGKLDIIIQLPYVIKSEERRLQAEKRRKDIEDQLTGSKYGIAYTDGTERITQLNRAAENNLLKQVEYLTNLLYSQLGLTPEIINGTADEATMINYFERTIKPFLEEITQAMTKTFLSRTARTQGQRVKYYRDPFSLVPVSQFAEIADKFTRNEIASSNDMRTSIGWKPSKDPKADELRNSNLSAPKDSLPLSPTSSTEDEDVYDETVDNPDGELDVMTSEFDGVIADIDAILEELGLDPEEDENE